MTITCRYFTRRSLDQIPQIRALPEAERVAMRAVSAVLPFRVNNYVLDELIDWDDVPADPLFQQTFPQRGMLAPADLARMIDLVRRDASKQELSAAARQIQLRLNPHPAGQLQLNVPRLRGATVPGVQHKYRETVLAFPSQGQTCHAYCAYCFRWPQFVGLHELKFANREAQSIADYVAAHREVTDVLFTGGDPMIMKARSLERYIEPLLGTDFDHVSNIRIGSKALSFWPYRFLSDRDADELLRLFERVVAAGKHLAFMAHVTHPRELSTPAARRAVRRIRATGAVIRSQSPILARINDRAEVWRELWHTQVGLGITPYYMFVARDTGPQEHFEVPLARALRVFNDAYRSVSGLGRSVRGPSMSATPGKVLIDGETTLGGQRVFVLKLLQARDPAQVGRVVPARYDESAAWLSDLSPVRDEDRWLFETPEPSRLGGLPTSVAPPPTVS